MSGKIEILTLLLNFGANPNLINPKCNRSILMIAASNGDIESVNLILEFKANVLYKDKQGQNALFYALNSKKRRQSRCCRNVGTLFY